MTTASDFIVEITPQVLLKAYACGIFPMAESAEDPALYWIEPEQRGVIPLDRVHIPRRLARTVRADRFEICVDRDFEAVLTACAAPGRGRRKTWINQRIRALYGSLHQLGHCHSVEAWRDGRLVGGLYGVVLRGAFFGESMFHRERDASKVVLAHLIARLKRGGFKLLDTQFMTDHLRQFGTEEVSRQDYHRMLEAALAHDGNFYCLGSAAGGAGTGISGAEVLQLVNQTSKTGCSTA